MLKLLVTQDAVATRRLALILQLYYSICGMLGYLSKLIV